MGRQKSFRSFVAIPLPDHAKAELQKFQTRLQKLNLPLTWENSDKLHITISFLGKIKDTDLYQLKTKIDPTLGNTSPFELTPAFLDYFYKKHADSIIFIGLLKSPELLNLEKSIREILIQNGFSPPQRFQPHINIARLKRLRHPNQVKQVLSSVLEYPPPKFSPFLVDHLVVYESLYNRSENISQYHPRLTLKFGNSIPPE